MHYAVLLKLINLNISSLLQFEFPSHNPGSLGQLENVPDFVGYHSGILALGCVQAQMEGGDEIQF